MYNAYVTRIKDIRKHSNADRLMVGVCFGNSIIISKDVNEGDLGIYFPTDGRLGIEYAEANNLVRKKDDSGNDIGGYLDPNKRHISTLKLRGESSDGLFMPIDSLKDFTDISKLKEGDTITVLDGVVICEKYVPVKKSKVNPQNPKGTKQKKEETVSYPNFKEHIDTKQLAYSTSAFKEGDIVQLTLKMHGTSARTSYSLKEERKLINKHIYKLLGLFGYKNTPKKSYEFVSGTRRVVLKNFEGGFYGTNSFRQPYHDAFKDKLMKGETAFYEIVGYQSEDRLIMASGNNKKVNDKKFVKEFGKTTDFTYGCEKGQSDMYIYRMNLTNEDGYVVEYSPTLIAVRAEQMGMKVCPVLETFIFTTPEDLMERVEKYLDIADPVGKTHINEGVVARILGKERFAVYKHKGIFFKIIEGLIKSEAIEPDMEEMEENQDEVVS